MLVFPARLMTTGSIALSSSSECLTMSSTPSESTGLSASAMTPSPPQPPPVCPALSAVAEAGGGRRRKNIQAGGSAPASRKAAASPSRGGGGAEEKEHQAGRRAPARQHGVPRLGRVRRVSYSRRACQRRERMGIPLKAGNRPAPQHLPPLPPPRQLRQVVGPDQPDEG